MTQTAIEDQRELGERTVALVDSVTERVQDVPSSEHGASTANDRPCFLRKSLVEFGDDFFRSPSRGVIEHGEYRIFEVTLLIGHQLTKHRK